MNVIIPQRADIDHPDAKKQYTSSLRLWHWLSALAITALLITVLINSTLLESERSDKSAPSIIGRNGIAVSPEQTAVVQHDLREQIWHLHTYIGYGLAALFLFRILLEFFEAADKRLINKIKKAYSLYFVIKKERELALHEFFVKMLYTIFYIILGVSVITGLCLAFRNDFAVIKAARWIKEVHEINMYLIIGFILVHLAGVYLAERNKDSKGIVSDMINGGESG